MATTILPGFQALSLPIAQLSLAAVLKCGQSFRWSIFPLSTPSSTTDTPGIPTHEYRFCLRDRVVCLRQSPSTLFYRSVFPEPPHNPTQSTLRDAETLMWLRDYFQLEVDLVALYEEWGKRDGVFRGIRERFVGIRMLRQDPWENLVSFICSSNNNISRITKMVQCLCKHYSPPLLLLPDPFPTATSEEPGQRTYHPFPAPSVLAASDVSSTLRSLGFGYRAEFIQRTAAMLVNNHGSLSSGPTLAEPPETWLKNLRVVSTDDARKELLKFIGVGRKVADCVLLMSLDKREVIPVDTHVHQIAIKHYGLRSSKGKAKANMTPRLYDEVSAKLVTVWGEYAGWAHSVLFTSDLKSFSLHGLPLPSPSLAKKVRPVLSTPRTPSPSPMKRMSSRQPATNIVTVTQAVSLDGLSHVVGGVPESMSLAERAKKRRRVGHN